MGPRDTGIAGASKVHRGTDYGTPCGTKISGPPAGCVKTGPNQINGYGNVVQFDCGNGIKLQYAHLSSNPYNAASNTITTGDTGVGACHLDFIVTLDGKVVDGQCSTGTVGDEYTYGRSSVKHGAKCPASGQINLCSPEVREALKKHADQVLKGTGKDGYNIGDGTTNPGEDHSDDHHDDETGPGNVVVQGNGGLDGTGGVTGDVNDTPVEEPQPDPEETPPTPPTPKDAYDGKSTKPECDNSTCITQDTIDNAKHKRVEYDKADPHWDYLKPNGECKDPPKTGANVFRQEAGTYKSYADAFCTNQGCTYVNESGSGDGKCQ